MSTSYEELLQALKDDVEYYEREYEEAYQFMLDAEDNLDTARDELTRFELNGEL